jgi:hypothetical protein
MLISFIPASSHEKDESAPRFFEASWVRLSAASDAERGASEVVLTLCVVGRQGRGAGEGVGARSSLCVKISIKMALFLLIRS